MISRLFGRPLLVLGAAATAAVGLPLWLSVQTPLTRTQSLLLVFAGLVYFAAGDMDFLTSDEPESGREIYNVGWLRGRIDGLRSRRSDDPAVVPSDQILKRDDGATTPYPTLDLSRSHFVLGQSGQGKSTYIKLLCSRWNIGGTAVFAHALREASGHELEQFFGRVGRNVKRLSSVDSNCRWNPFADYDRSIKSARDIAAGMTKSSDSVQTGWSDSAESLLAAAILVTWYDSDDIADLPVILDSDPADIVEAADKVGESSILTRPLKSMGESELETAHASLLNEIGQLLETDMFDKSLPDIAFTDYIEEPIGTVIIDNRGKDYTAPLWRFTINRAIELSDKKRYPCRFVLDEFDKLPHISKLKKLASAGRSSESIGILSCQDRHQLEAVYPDLGQSIWSNSPNRATFAVGDAETANLALSSLGERELMAESRSGIDDGEDSISRSVRDQLPVTTGELEDLDIGEAMIQSKGGWWVADLTEPDLTVDTDDAT